MFTENELSMIRFALDYLHDGDLSEFKKEDLEALESAMKKFDMEFDSYIDLYYD